MICTPVMQSIRNFGVSEIAQKQSLQPGDNTRLAADARVETAFDRRVGEKARSSMRGMGILMSRKPSGTEEDMVLRPLISIRKGALLRDQFASYTELRWKTGVPNRES